MQKKIIKYLILLIVLLISSINFNLFLKPLNIVTGGTQGISLILLKLFYFDPAISILVINILMLILSYLFLPKETTLGSLISSLVYPIFVKFTSNITNLISLNNLDPFICIILTGIISGITLGIIYKLGFSSGGISLLPIFIKKIFKTPVGISNFIVNIIIIILGAIYFGLEKCLYAIIVIMLNSYLINKIMLGRSKYKTLYVKSNKDEKIIKYLKDTYQINPIVLKAKGGYSGKDSSILLITIETSKYIRITNWLKEFDKNIFISVNDTYEYNLK